MTRGGVRKLVIQCGAGALARVLLILVVNS